MCSKHSPVGEEKQMKRTSKRIKKKKTTMEEKPPSNFEASRKIRSKTKKPKFLSLKLELNTCHENLVAKKIKKTTKKPSKQSKTKGAYTDTDTTAFKKTETVAGEDDQYDTVAAYLFNTTTDSTISSIHDLLPSSAVADVDCDNGGGRNLSSYEHGSSSSSLLKTAMKKGASEGEETTEERWVSYSEVVEEVMSRSGTPQCCDVDGGDVRPSLALKLDYEHIMEAWSEKGTLYVDGEPPQTVPDLHASANGFIDGGEARNLWAVPEMESTERLWKDHREASLLRYKEKRQNRLFSKRIRYQVRKLNAEKRPRIKGRFVKRNDS